MIINFDGYIKKLYEGVGGTGAYYTEINDEAELVKYFKEFLGYNPVYEYINRNIHNLMWRGTIERANFAFYKDSSLRQRTGTVTDKTSREMLFAWFDTHPQWAGWPPRSRSVFFTPDKANAQNFGDALVLVFAPLETVTAIAPSSDFWSGFEKNQWAPGILLDDLFFGVIIKEGIFRDWRDVVESLRKFFDSISDGNDYQHWKDVIKEELGPYVEANFSDFWYAYHEKGIDMERLLRDIFDPLANGFSKKSFGECLRDQRLGNRELWFCGPYIGIPEQTWKKLLKKDKFIKNKI